MTTTPPVPRRGEVWRYRPALARPDGQAPPDLRLIVSVDALAHDDALPVVLAVAVLPHDPGGLLAVAIGPGQWGSAVTLAPARKSSLAERLHVLDPDTMTRVDAALRAALDL